MLPPMFVSEPDTTAPSPWIAPARPHLQFSRASTLPLFHSARYCYGTQARPHTGRATWSPHSVGRLGAPWAGTALRAGRPMGGSSAASQLQADLLPEVPRTQPLAAFFFPSTAPIPIALALGHFFFTPHHQVDDKNHFRDPHAHLIHSRTQSPCSSTNLTPHPSRAPCHSVFVSTVQYSRTAQQQTVVVIIVLDGATRLLELGPVPGGLHWPAHVKV